MPEPYYSHGGIEIYHGDCREILPGLEPVDLVLTDPPYGIGEARKNHSSRDRFPVQRTYSGESWDDGPPDRETIAATVRAGAYAIVWGGNYFRLPPTSGWLVWDKDNGACDFADAEMAWTNLGGAVRLKKYRWAGMLQEHGGRHKETRWHPTQKPIPVMRWCIERAPDVLQTILDPFMGSGTTLRAAKDLGRKAIGIEIEERYCEIAARRLAQEAVVERHTFQMDGDA